MKPIYRTAMAMLVALTLLDCKKNEADPQVDADGSTSATVKLTQNGQVITQFQTVKAAAVGGNEYSIVISNADDKHSISLSIAGKSSGTYPFIQSTETLTSGKSSLVYLSDDLPENYPGTPGTLLLDTGQTVLKTVTANRCSGSFTGTGKNLKDGKVYTLEGTFDARVF
ncbi:hypothetical protein G8759_20725 [Spirosoma aureum]|uniref:Uncharacterized protein n=1 Tax=Spirosoma aureum TaxID=2692134 RepID=A0A6G9ARB3_9BACT|nr:hypothetical protein [Spirosoma aureum]QIP14869.1 hypothetical protein G8759_20725 [Spirosoma aureum]